MRAALGDEAWEGFPDGVRRMFAAASPAVRAALRGRGLDLSTDPWRPGADDLASVTVPVLVVSSEDAPPAFRRVDDRLVAALPRAEHVVVPGGHLIDPAGPAVLQFVDRLAAS